MFTAVNGRIDALFDPSISEGLGQETWALIYARKTTTVNYNLAIVYDPNTHTYTLQIREGLTGLIDKTAIAASVGNYFRFLVVGPNLYAYQSVDGLTWTLQLTYTSFSITAEGEWYASDVYQSGVTEVGVDARTVLLGERQVYDRPKVIAGRRIARVSGKLRSYVVAPELSVVFEGDVALADTSTQEVRIVHSACSGGSLSITSGGTLSGTPTYYTYSTVFTVVPSATTLHVELTGYAVTLEEVTIEKVYQAAGEVLEFECPIASDPTKTLAMFDHYVAVESSPHFEFTMRDDASLQVGDRAFLLLNTARVYGLWNYKLGEDTCLLSETTPLWTNTMSRTVPVVLTRIARSFDGSATADVVAVLDIDPD